MRIIFVVYFICKDTHLTPIIEQLNIISIGRASHYMINNRRGVLNGAAPRVVSWSCGYGWVVYAWDYLTRALPRAMASSLRGMRWW